MDALLDERLRVRAPLWTWLGTTLLTGTLVTWLLPAAGAVLVAAALLRGAAAARALGLAGARRTAVEEVAARAALSRRVLEVVADARPLAHWQAAGPALDRVGTEAVRRGRAARRRTRWVATARLWPAVAVAAAVAGTAVAVSDSTVSGPVAALLLLVPLALADVLVPVADAGALRVRHPEPPTTGSTPWHALEPATTDPGRPAPTTGGAIEARRCHRRLAGREVTAPPCRRSTSPCPAGAAVARRGRTVRLRQEHPGRSTAGACLAPASGRYALGGTGTHRLGGDDVRTVVGLLDDDPYVFSSTLAENVRLARPDATDEDVADALGRARLGEWLTGLPDGLATRLGDGAASVSGGERARIGLARLLLADHPVLVLDEPTAHLDAPARPAGRHRPAGRARAPQRRVGDARPHRAGQRRHGAGPGSVGNRPGGGHPHQGFARRWLHERPEADPALLTVRSEEGLEDWRFFLMKQRTIIRLSSSSRGSRLRHPDHRRGRGRQPPPRRGADLPAGRHHAVQPRTSAV